MPGYDRARPASHWIDFPDTTYGLVGSTEFGRWDTAVYELKNVAVNPKDFGAVMDGVTDDTAAWNLAVSNLAGRPLFLPPGTLKGGTLTVPDGTTIIGSGRAGIINGSLQAGDDCSVLSLRVDGTASTHLQVGARSLVAGCRLSASSGACAGIKITGSDTEVVDNYLDWTGATNTMIVTNKSANNCRILGNQLIGGTAGIHVGGSGGTGISASRNVVANNTVRNTVDDGILFGTDWTVDTGTDNIAIGNLIYNVQANLSDPSSLGVGLESHLYYTQFRGNTIVGCGGHGIYTVGPYALIDGNFARGNALQFTGYRAGIKIVGSHTVVSGNFCRDNGQPGSNVGHGILFSADAMDILECVAIGNICNDSRAVGSKGQVWGLHVAEPSTFRIKHLLCTNNSVLDNFNGSGDSGNLNIGTLSGPNWSFNNSGQDQVLGRQSGGTATWDPASLADGAATTTSLTVTNARLGDVASAAFSLALPAGAILTAGVTASNTVQVTLLNKTGGTLDLASGTVRVIVTHFE
jgi:hypothetical protein